MKRFLILFLLPVMGYAGAVMRAFERFDPFYDYSETFYYGNIQTSFNRPLAGIGLRYKDEELGFDAGIAGAYAAKDVDGIIQAEASVLYFPFTDYVYLGMGAGVGLETFKRIYGKTFLRGTLGGEYRSERFGKYFAEATIQAPTQYEEEGFHFFPGFRVGIGF